MLLSRNLSSIRDAAVALARCEFGAVHQCAMSVRDGSSFCVTRDAACLPRVTMADLVATTLFRRNDPGERLASGLGLHRAVYLATQHRAIIQAMPPATLAASVGAGPRLELLRPAGVIVIELAQESDLRQLGDRIGAALRREGIAVVRGSAVFAAAQELAEAAELICGLEEDAKRLCGREPKACSSR